MKKKRNFSVLFLGLCILGGIWAIKSKSHKDEGKLASLRSEQNRFCFPIRIAGFSLANHPQVEVEIEGKPFLVALDLGFQGALSLFKESIERVRAKTFVSSEIKYGFRGNGYPVEVYRIPQLKMGEGTFGNVTLWERSYDLRKESLIIQTETVKPPEDMGSIGWRLFSSGSLFLDLANSQIVVCDSFQTLVEQGCSIDGFVKEPLFLNHGFVEIYAKTEDKILECLLDTGASLNILNVENSENLSPEEIFSNPDNLTEFESFCIGGLNLGKKIFQHLPVKTPHRFDAILGMPFFMEHRVIIDFQGKWVYIAPIEQKIDA